MSRHPGRAKFTHPGSVCVVPGLWLTDRALAFAAGCRSHSLNDHTDNVGNVQRTYKWVRQPMRCSFAMATRRGVRLVDVRFAPILLQKSVEGRRVS